MTTETKLCRGCRETKSASDFYRYSRSPDGLQARCKTCCKKYADDIAQGLRKPKPLPLPKIRKRNRATSNNPNLNRVRAYWKRIRTLAYFYEYNPIRKNTK